MTAETIAPALGEKYVSEALSRRGDQLAAHLSTQAQAALLEGAKSNLKPRVDFALTVGFAGLDARPGRFRPGYALSNDLNGANAAGTFSLDWPTANRVARGGVISQRAAAEQARLSAVLSANTIAADVLVALETLRRVIAECALSQQATDAYGRSLAQTSEKMKAGEATLTELIDMEDRYAGARRSRNDTLRRYAITLAQLRLLTGTLSAAADQRAVFDTAVLTAVPTFTP
jgi:outer membrane protein TolC